MRIRSYLNAVLRLINNKLLLLLPPKRFRPEGEIPRRHSSNSRVYSHTVNIEKLSICLNGGREESVGNDDVSVVCARKYEMVRMT